MWRKRTLLALTTVVLIECIGLKSSGSLIVLHDGQRLGIRRVKIGRRAAHDAIIACHNSWLSLEVAALKERAICLWLGENRDACIFWHYSVVPYV